VIIVFFPPDALVTVTADKSTVRLLNCRAIERNPAAAVLRHGHQLVITIEERQSEVFEALAFAAK
jgi:hypothetical protein